MIHKCKRIFLRCVWPIEIMCSQIIEIIARKNEEIAFFDPSLDTYNLGDNIISHYCRAALSHYFDCDSIFAVKTHHMPDKLIRYRLIHVRNKVVFGTNLISPCFERYSIWAIPHSLLGYRNTITMGVGAGQHSRSASCISSFIYRNIFSKKGLHSVRDSNTEQLFHKMGIHNVVNTGCPSLWNLTPELCSRIPTKKAKNVITTITDYDRDPDRDSSMIAILREEYDKVYVWIQGADDLAYLKELIDIDSVELVERSVEAYTAILKKGEIDYIGTRLHAGIHALNLQIRSLIISIDNRAIEMGKDFSLPVLDRTSINDKLRVWINGEHKTELYLPWDNITLWKNQFRKAGR